jgi:hypothetical protein
MLARAAADDQAADLRAVDGPKQLDPGAPAPGACPEPAEPASKKKLGRPRTIKTGEGGFGTPAAAAAAKRKGRPKNAYIRAGAPTPVPQGSENTRLDPVPNPSGPLMNPPWETGGVTASSPGVSSYVKGKNAVAPTEDSNLKKFRWSK